MRGAFSVAAISSFAVAIERGIEVLPKLFDGDAEAAMMALHTVAE